jgi:hypothetical protein
MRDKKHYKGIMQNKWSKDRSKSYHINISGVSSPVRRQRLAECIKKKKKSRSGDMTQMVDCSPSMCWPCAAKQTNKTKP